MWSGTYVNKKLILSLQEAKDCVRIILNRVKYVGINGIIVLAFVDHKEAIID